MSWQLGMLIGFLGGSIYGSVTMLFRQTRRGR